MLKIYAIISKETNTVLNIIHAEQEEFIFFNSETEYFAFANRAVEIGMIYDKETGKFPEAGDKGEIIDMRDKIESLVSNHLDLILQNSHLKEDQLQIHLDYVSNLREVLTKSSYDDMKSHFDSIGEPPEFPPTPKEITQDVFRGTLKLSEKLLWDNPETGTTQQTAVINTLKMDFPYYGVENMSEELALLEQVGFFTTERVIEVIEALS